MTLEQSIVQGKRTTRL